MKKNKFIETENKNNLSLVITLFILICLGLIIGSVTLIMFEINEAKNACENISGKYTLDFKHGHLCDNKEFFKQSICLLNKCRVVWTFENNNVFNVSEFIK